MPGTMGIHASARAAVPVRHGSTTTVRPPRARMPSIAPSTSGVGMAHIDPYMSRQATFFGHWSTVPAE